MTTFIPLITAGTAGAFIGWVFSASDAASILAIATIAVAVHIAAWETLRTWSERKTGDSRSQGRRSSSVHGEPSAT